jgi:Gas vesicle synthesis protein GvpL/GvpF
VSALQRVWGRQEWGVKAYAVEGSASGEEAGPVAEASGTAYLRRRQAALQSARESRQTASTGAMTVHTRLSEFAVAARQHRPQDPSLSGDRRRMLLNGAYLVDEARAEQFVRVVSGLSESQPDLAVELTGPWPPYSFAVVENGAGT